MWLDLAQARCVEQLLPGLLIGDAHADVVALMRIVAMRRVRGCLALEGYRSEAQALDSIDDEAAARTSGQTVPVDSAIVAEDIEQRIAGGHILLNHIRAPDLQRLLPFAQHQQASGVVDLPVHERNRFDTGISDRASWLQRGKCLQLREDVG